MIINEDPLYMLFNRTYRTLLIVIVWITISTTLFGCGEGSGDSISPAEEAADSTPPSEEVADSTPPAGEAAVDRTWHNASLIENDDTGNLLSIEPKVVMDTVGNANVVWNQALPNTLRIMSNRFLSGADWGIAEVINNLAYGSHPEIAIDTNGNAFAVWEQFDGIWSNRFTAGIGWGHAELVGLPNTPGGLVPRIGFDSDGTAIAVWQQGDGFRTNIWSNRHTPSLGWGIPELIETNDSGDAQDPQVAVDSSGDALAVWRQADATGRISIWSNYYKKGVGWGTPELVETINFLASNPQVAFDGHGHALAVWSQWSNSGSDIWANQYTSGLGWGEAILLETDDTGAAYSPQVAFDSEGNALVIWTQWATITRTGPCLVALSVGSGSSCIPTTVTISNIWSRRYSALGGWGNREQVETNDQGNASNPRLAFDRAGNAIAVWTQPNSKYISVWANHYKSGTGWGTATAIQSNDTGDAMYPTIAVGAEGDAIAVWGQSDGVRANVWANRFY